MIDETEIRDGEEPRPYKYKYKYRYKYADDAKHGDDKEDGADDEQSDDDDKKDDGKDKDKDKEKSPEQKKKDKRKKIFIFGGLGALVVIALIVWILLYIFVFSQRETTDDAYVGGDQVIISSKVSGTVVQVLVDDTEPVHAGQVLVRLNPADTGAALEGAEGQLAQAVRQTEQQTQQAALADAQMNARQADLDRAAAEYRRRAPLLAANATSQEDVTNAKQQMIAAQAALEQARRQANAAHAAVDGVDARTSPAVLQARSQYVMAWINNARNGIVAPIDGYAAQRQVQVGQQVAPGQRLLVVIPLERLWVDANFKESQLHNIRIGQPATVVPDIYHGDVEFHGHVVGLAAGTGSAFSLLPPQNASGNWIKIVQRVPVRIAIDAGELQRHPLRIGLSTDTKIDTHDRNGTVLATVPRQEPLDSTGVYGEELSDADSAADAIIARNLTSTPNTRAGL
ncbi:MAG TPA: efflux RND transporter periplasmic adaptor subunit [Rudaea sp.]|jgi:membrane fusion protein (multidrug efflux system)|nr:efflux RND transporter periplasmic adaptor subunit [Rudaea sp.]